MPSIANYLTGVSQSILATVITVGAAWLLFGWATGWVTKYRDRAREHTRDWPANDWDPRTVLYETYGVRFLGSPKDASPSRRVQPGLLRGDHTTLIGVGRTGSGNRTRRTLAEWLFRSALDQGAAAPILIECEHTDSSRGVSGLLSSAQPDLWRFRAVKRLVPHGLRPQVVGLLMERLVGDMTLIVNNTHLLESHVLDELVSYARSRQSRLLMLSDVEASEGLRFVFEHDGSVDCYLLGRPEAIRPESAEGIFDALVRTGRVVLPARIWREGPSAQADAVWATALYRKDDRQRDVIKYVPGLDPSKRQGAMKLYAAADMEKGRTEELRWHVPSGDLDGAGNPIPDGPTLASMWVEVFSNSTGNPLP